MSLVARISGRLERLAGRLLLFVPVCLGLGIGAYFALPVEPGPLVWATIATAAAAAGLGGRHLVRSRYAGLGFLASGLALALAGVLVAGLRTELSRAPVLGFRYYGAVEGRVVKIDRSASGAPRLTLDRVRLDRVAPGERPARVRVSLLGAQDFLDPIPGQRVAMTAYLSAPDGPVEPGGFDFRRMAWYDRIGALGYSRSPALLLDPGQGGFGGMAVERWRQQIAKAVRAAIPGAAGGFAAAITTGDRAQMDPGALQDLRDANLAHLLAISGLHMGLLSGFVFAAVRLMLAAVPGLAARIAIRKIAAVVALQAAAAYLALSGGNVATERAFIMVGVMFGAVLIDRRALTLRAVAVAAVLILLAEPESLTEPGFQMSFAATTGLVAVFSALRDWRGRQIPRWLRGPAGVFVSSLVAGLSTAPFAAAHFNQVSHVGLIANLLAVPVMGLAVMPLAVLAAVLAPLGLSGLALSLMRFPILWILGVAHWVAGLDGAVGHVVSPGPWVLPLIAAGGLIFVLMAGRARAAGLLPLIFGFALWGEAERPAGLVAATGGLVGVIGPEGRALSKPKGDSFAASVWLENDGDSVSQAEAARRPGLNGERGSQSARIGPARLVHLTGRGAADRVAKACETADLVVVSVAVADLPAGCAVYDETRLAQSGALALRLEAEGLRVVTVAQLSGDRPWTRARR